MIFLLFLVLFFRCSGDDSAQDAAFFLSRFPPASSVDVVVKEDPRGPGRAITSGDVIENHDCSVTREFDHHRHWNIQLSSLVIESGNHHPIVVLHFFRFDYVIGVLLVFAKADRADRRPRALESRPF